MASGTDKQLALLVTDVVDSTRVSIALGEQSSALLWAAHDRLARDLIPQWRGREIDKSDGMLLLFDCADDAIGYANAYHTALKSLDPPLEARVGLHVGAVVLRQIPTHDVARGAKPVEVDGAVKSIAARIMSTAHGGQTLISKSAHAMLSSADRATWQPLGYWKLKGVPEPVRLYAAAISGAAQQTPADSAKAYRVYRDGDQWLPVREIRHSLPAERDAFVGRGAPLARLSELFDNGHRLVSVLGIGGLGKTRLVTQFGWRSLGEFPGGIWFCDLSQARSADGIVNAVALGLDLSLSGGDTATQIGRALASRGPTLVILDNFEQVTAFAPATVGAWLSHAPATHFLVTTREVLGLPGETALILDPLVQANAVALFLARAAAVRPGWQPDADDRRAIATLVRLLDRLPLAIELAAARVRIMSPRTLLQRMDQRFKLLASTHGRVDRQATLRAVFDWSWDLLTDSERSMLAQLSVFEDGFTLDAVEGVVDLSMVAEPGWIVDALQSLVQKSLVRQIGTERFGLLVSVQEYAAEHIATPGRFAGSGPDAQREAQQRHGAWFAALPDAEVQAAGCPELENLVAACRRAAQRRDTELAARLLERSWAALKIHGPFSAGVQLAEKVLAIDELEGRARASVELLVGNALEASGRDVEAYAQYEASCATARTCGDRVGVGRALRSLGSLDAYAGRPQTARVRLDEASTIAAAVADPGLAFEVQNSLGTLEQIVGRTDRAHEHYQRALELARDSGDRHGEARALGNLAIVCIDRGELAEATEYDKAALLAAREIGNRRLEGNTLNNLGLLHQMSGRLEEAQATLTLALAVARDLGQPRLECLVLCNIGIVQSELGRSDSARESYEASLEVARASGDQHAEGEVLGYLGLLHARADRPAEARRCLEDGEALLRKHADQTSLAVLLCARAEACHRAGEPAAARSAFDEAATIAAQIGAGPESEIGLALVPVRQLLGIDS